MSSLAINLRTRRARLELTQKDLANRAGVSQQLIHSLETGVIRSTKFVKEIALALGCAITDLDPKYGGVNDYGESSADLDGRHGDLPIYNAAEVEDGMVVIPDVPFDYITRPFPLQNVRGGYGVLVALNLMYPEFDVGDYVLVNPHLPPVPNTSCLFYSETTEGTVGRIRRLVAVTTEHWEVMCWNLQTPQSEPSPDKLLRGKWKKCHRIVGRYVRR